MPIFASHGQQIPSPALSADVLSSVSQDSCSFRRRSIGIVPPVLVSDGHPVITCYRFGSRERGAPPCPPPASAQWSRAPPRSLLDEAMNVACAGCWPIVHVIIPPYRCSSASRAPAHRGPNSPVSDESQFHGSGESARRKLVENRRPSRRSGTVLRARKDLPK